MDIWAPKRRLRYVSMFQVIDHQRLPFQRHTCGMCKTYSFLPDRAFLLFHFASVAMDELDLDLYGALAQPI